MVVQIILAIVKGVYTTNIATADVMQEIIKMSMSASEVDDFESAFSSAGTAFSMITVGGICAGCWALLAARFCNKAMGGCCTKWYTFCGSVSFLTISIIFFLLGSTLIVIKDQFSEEFINRECANAKLGYSDTAKLDLNM
jgi:hypothetical protein